MEKPDFIIDNLWNNLSERDRELLLVHIQIGHETMRVAKAVKEQTGGTFIAGVIGNTQDGVIQIVPEDK